MSQRAADAGGWMRKSVSCAAPSDVHQADALADQTRWRPPQFRRGAWRTRICQVQLTSRSRDGTFAAAANCTRSRSVRKARLRERHVLFALLQGENCGACPSQ